MPKPRKNIDPNSTVSFEANEEAPRFSPPINRISGGGPFGSGFGSIFSHTSPPQGMTRSSSNPNLGASRPTERGMSRSDSEEGLNFGPDIHISHSFLDFPLFPSNVNYVNELNKLRDKEGRGEHLDQDEAKRAKFLLGKVQGIKKQEFKEQLQKALREKIRTSAVIPKVGMENDFNPNIFLLRKMGY